MSVVLRRALLRALLAAFVLVAVAVAVPALANLSDTGPAGPVGPASVRAAVDAAADPSDRGGEGSSDSIPASGAQRALERHFADVLDEPENALALPPGGEIERYLGDHAARIGVPDGPDQIALSALPLRTRDEEGRLAPVDLALETDGDALKPANPLVDVSVPERLDDGVEIGDEGLEVYLGERGSAAAAARELSGNKAVFVEAAEAADWLVGPVPTGVEALLQIRGADAAERHELVFELPEATRLEKTADGGVEATRDGDVVARVSPPSAIDAAGRTVPVRYEVSGATIILVVSHREPGVSFPVLVDPVIEDWGTSAAGGGWFNNPGLDQLGWSFESVPAGALRSQTTGSSIASFGAPPGRGLYALVPPAVPGEMDHAFPWATGTWRWQAPGDTTFIRRAEFRDLFFTAGPGRSAKSLLATGLWNGAAGEWSGLHADRAPLAGANRTVEPLSGLSDAKLNDTDTALFGVHAAGRGQRWATAYLGGVVLYLDDPEPARVTRIDGTDRWLGQGAELTVEAEDPGLGVRRIEVTSGDTAPFAREHGCLGNRLEPCPRTWTQRIPTDTLAEGRSRIAAIAQDAAGKRSAPLEAAVAIDRTGPALDLSGSLRDLRDGWASDLRTLHVAATDADGAGVKSVELRVAGERRELTEQPCADSACPLARDFDVDLSSVAEGRQPVKVVAVDHVGNRSEESWSVGVDRTDPALAVSGGLVEATDRWVDGSLELRAMGSDAGSGVERIEVLVDGARTKLAERSCSEGGCDLGLDWTLDTGTIPEGRHLVQVVVVDAAGRTAQRHFVIGVDRSRPDLELSGALAEAAGKEVRPPLAMTARAADAGSGIRQLEILLDGQRQDLAEQSCDGGGCGLERSWQLPADLGPGDHLLRAVATDGAGRGQAQEVSFRVASDGTTAPTPLSSSATTPLVDAARFLYSGPDPVQTGMTAAIAPTRAAVLRGKALGPDGGSLAGATVRIAGRPDYGQTLTDDDGHYSLAVNGGGLMTVAFAKDGYLDSERQLDVPWQDYVWVEDVALTPLDAAATQVDLAGGSDEVQVARGTEVQDEDGRRQATLMFAPGTSAEMVLPDGERRAVTDATVRATEFTVGDAGPERMPGELPATSAYTYAAEFNLDEALRADARSVRFSKPVAAYIENFLDVPVGVGIPTGYYDRQAHAWKPMTDGRVVRIVSEQEGVAEVDVTGDGVASTATQLDTIGIDLAERRRLAELYEPGDTLSRLTMRHFTPVDGNYPFRMPPGARGPDGRFPKDKTDEDCADQGSIIGCENQTLGEAVDLAGTDFKLHFESDRTPGSANRRSFRLKLVGDEVHKDLEKIVVETMIAGRRFKETVDATPNRIHAFTWDGKDAFGRTVQGTQTARIKVGYQYDVEYATAVPYTVAEGEDLGGGAFTSSWGAMPDPLGDRRMVLVSAGGGGGGGGATARVTMPPTRGPITLWQEYRRDLGVWDARAAGLGGWTLDAHHAYDPIARVLHMGDGSTRSAESVNATISQLETPKFGVYGGRAQAGIDVGPDGTVYTTDFYGDRVYKRLPNGTVELVAGNPPDPSESWQSGSFGGDGGPAIKAELDGPNEVEVTPDGSLLIADVGNHRIRKVATDGTISTVAGNGSTVQSGDGGPATKAGLAAAGEVEVGPDGSFYILDALHAKVRKVDPSGKITTVFGGDTCNGSDCSNWLGFFARAIALAPDGALWVAGTSSTGYTRLLRKTPDGRAAQVGEYLGQAGGEGFVGAPDRDGVPLSEANLSIVSLEFGPDGLLYMVEGRRIRRVDSDGLVRRVAGGGDCRRPDVPTPDGTGWTQDLGDNGPATQACLPAAKDIAFSADGTMVISDHFQRLRKVSSGLPGFSNNELSVPSKDGTALFRFDKDGRHLSTLDAHTGRARLTFAYDGDGRLATIKDAYGNTTRVERANGQPAAIVGPYGARTALGVRDDGWLGEIRDPEGGRHRLDYGPGGLLTSFTDPEDHTTSFAYEDDGRLRQDTGPDGDSKTLTRTQSTDGYEVTVTTKLGRARRHSVELDPDGSTRRRVVEPTGARTEQVTGNGRTTLAGADGSTVTTLERGDPRWGSGAPYAASQTLTTPGGRRTSIIRDRQVKLEAGSQRGLKEATDTLTVNGRTSTTTWTPAARSLVSRTPLQKVLRTTTDADGQPIEKTVTGITPWTFGYDAHGRLDRTAQGDRAWAFSYDAGGNLAGVAGPEGYSRAYRYDRAGRMTHSVFPDGREVAFTYDKAGRLTSITPPGRPGHHLATTPGGRASGYTPPASSEHSDVAERFTYDDDGRLKTVSRPGSPVISHEYDAAGQLRGSDAGEDHIGFGYQADGARKLDRVTSPGGVAISFEYDGPLLTSETWAGPVNGNVTYTYDDDLRPVAIKVNDTAPVAQGYDLDGLLTRAGSLTYQRRADNGALRGTTLESLTSSVAQNAFGELAGVSFRHGDADLFSFDLVRDRLGRITSRTETADGATDTYGYTYDRWGRLESVVRNGHVWRSYGYDANGNRTREAVAGQLPVTSSYDDQDRLLNRGGVSYRYSATGALTERVHNEARTRFSYDGFGQLERVELPTGKAVDYLIDGAGRRIGRKVDGVLAESWLYGNGADPIAELDRDGQVTTRFVYGARPQVPEYMERNGRRYRLVSDDAGSVRRVIDATTAEVVQVIDYDPYGRVLRDTSPGFQPFGFAGGLTDPDTSLVRFGARDYDPETGRWTSKDPSGFSGGDLSLYGYVLNDPVNLIDPTGHVSTQDISEGAAGALDTLTFGLSNRIAGVSALCSNAYRIGSLLGDVNPKGAIKAVAQRGVKRFAARSADDAGSPTAPFGRPGPDFEWRGPADKGSWYNPRTGEYWRPDPHHPAPQGPHWDHRDSDGGKWRVYPDGQVERKRSR